MKEYSCEGCNEKNQPPLASAGRDTLITLPADSSVLDGSGSSDPDGTISAWQWSKISGPASFAIVNSSAEKTTVKNLTAGVYLFELKVTDDKGASATDTVQISVSSQLRPPIACDNSNRPQVNARLIPVGTLSQARSTIAVASAGNKIVFAGGFSKSPAGDLGLSSRVDIYDITTQSWTTAELSIARNFIAAVANGNKIFFAGGEVSDGTFPTNTVDMYDVSTNSWSVAQLSEAGQSIAAAAVGNKVLFAGGERGFNITPGIPRDKTVDIYDLSTGKWSRTELSVSRSSAMAVTVANKVYFAGGGHRVVDIFDNGTNSWSTTTMIEGKSDLAGIAIGNNIYWAGGMLPATNPQSVSCQVEVRDVNTGQSTIHYLSAPKTWWVTGGQNAVTKNAKIIFFSHNPPGLNKFDIYDIASNTWSIGVLPENIEWTSIISVNNTVYIAGGIVNGVFSDKVYKLEF